MLTVTVRDDPGQTRMIVQETGRRAAHGAADVDISAFVAAQRWLATGGVCEVVVPFGEVLGNLVYAGAVRMRRDFEQLLTLISASALLHQRQRPRDDRGRVVATLQDYATVYDLAAEVFNATAADDLTPAQREAVQAVIDHNKETGEKASFQDVARRLGIDKSSARRRLIRPRANGFVVNEEERKGYPARLKLGDPLPEVRPAIPTPEALVEAGGGMYGNPPPSRNDCPTATPLAEGAPEAAGDRGSWCGSAQGAAGTADATATPTATVEPLDGPAFSRNRGSEAAESEGTETAGSPSSVGDRSALPPFEDGDRRAVVVRMGKILGWPEFEFKRGNSIAEGEENWRTFAATASGEDITLALRVLEAYGSPGDG